VGLLIIRMEPHKIFFLVERREISYLRWIIESYDGIAFIKTIDPYQAIIELEISPGCDKYIYELFDFLRRQEHVHIEEMDSYANPVVQAYNQ
jgi:hypothetical protein